ncbi:MAG TPA: nucleoside-diphosphate sugar epimerase/dehydratase, partial [Steroidobacteraceae bacterium]|nr:nucleoside-diphosphate sugar epimerase/dehydratase [Steroidobacteraceae bacterium]
AFSAAALAGLNAAAVSEPVPVETFFIYFAASLLYVGLSRFAARELLRLRVSDAAPVIVYGAGAAGAQLCASLRTRGQYKPIAIVDDNATMWGAQVCGVEVRSPADVLDIRREDGASLVLLAIPSASRRRRGEVIDRLTTSGFTVQTVPEISEIISGQSRLEEIRDIDVHDLLGRDPVPPNTGLLAACVRGKSIMVTGAGGSIGSELCRQIMELAPRRLILLEVSELALYEIERELRSVNARHGNRIDLVALLGNAHHKHRVREIMTTFGIQTVYHAAAYKHVPIVEHNIIEGIHNNIFATYNTAEAALECRVETFVLVSTDKAVNPTNVMGCTKRVAEMVLQGLHQRAAGTTRFCMVRFGNVLESSGSVVPLFREQIREGGPVTVTHPDVIRYFMTIPEASQLVIQAGSMGSGGDVFVLDMGSPVRIADLAKRMIQLAGYTVRDDKHPDGDIEIRFTGLRPAEKMFEELLIGKNVTGTEHPRILRAMEHSLTWDQMRHVLDDLAQCSIRFDCERARDILLRAVPEYRPTDRVQDLVWLQGGGRVSGAQMADEEKVRELRPRPIS